MRKRWRKQLCLLMLFCMVLGSVPAYKARAEAGSLTDLITSDASVTASSSIANNSTWALKNLVDGNLKKGASTGDKGRDDQNYNDWMQIKLKSPVTLNTVWLYPRWDENMAKCFPVDFTIQLSSNGSNWKTVMTVTGCEPDSANPQKFVFFKENNVQYIRINVTKKGYEFPDHRNAWRLQLMEVEAYYDPAAVPSAELAAQSVNALQVDYNYDRLILPELEGFETAIESSSNDTLISLDNKVDTSQSGWSDIVLSVKSKSDPTDIAYTKPIRVNVRSLTELSMVEQKAESISASSSHKEWPVSHLIDGVLVDDIWASKQYGSSDGGAAGSWNVKEWVKLDFPAASNITRVVLYPRNKDNRIVFPMDFSISVSKDGSNWKKVVEKTGYTTDNSTAPQIFDFPKESGAAYVKIDFTKVPFDGSKYSAQLAEVKVYSLPDQDMSAQEIADGITTLQPLGLNDNSISFPRISNYFRIEIEQTSNPDIISADGTVTRPESEDCEVKIRFRITNKSNSEDVGFTEELPLYVVSEKNAAVNEVAKSIDFIELPENNADKITLPSAGSGYRVSIARSSHPDVVSTDGTITRSKTTTYPVKLTLLVEDLKTGGSAHTKELLVPVYKEYTAPQMSQSEINAIKKEYEQKKYGMFVHYERNTVYADGGRTVNVDELANGFDAEQFAKDMHDFGVEYVVLTAWHADVRTLFPSMTNQRWRDDRRTEAGGAKTYSERDVIQELLDALEPYDIDLHLYTHPSDGHDFTAEDQELTGWNDSTDSYGVWNDYVNELYYEVCERYGDRIKGLWFDGQFRHVSKGSVQTRLRKTCQMFNPAMILTMNTGFTEGQTNPMPNENCPDYRAWEVRHKNDLNAMRITHNQVAIIIGNQWRATSAQTSDIEINTPEEIFRYMAAQASISTSGGLLAAAGCYAVREDQDLNGNIWEKGMRDTLVSVNQYLEPVKESITNTNPGKAYPSSENETVNKTGWGVSTQSPDDKYIYLHVLNAPEGKVLNIGKTADGTVLNQNAVLMKFDGTKENVVIEDTENGYQIVLPEGETWNSVDTIIRAGRSGEVPDEPLKEADKNELMTTIESAESLDLTKYTEVGQEEFLGSLAEAKKVYRDKYAGQEDVDEACIQLQNAMQMLRLKADKSGLEEAVQKAGQIDPGKYNGQLAEEFKNILKKAKDMLSDDQLSEDDQQSVDQIAEELKRIIEKMISEEQDGQEAGAEENKDENKSENNNINTGSNSNERPNGSDVRDDVPDTGSEENLVCLLAVLLMSGVVLTVKIYLMKREERTDKR